MLRIDSDGISLGVIPSDLKPLAYPPKYFAPKIAQKPTNPTYHFSYFSLFDDTSLYSSSVIVIGKILSKF